MRITYSPDVDALAVELAPDAKGARMVKLTPDVNLDLDARDRLICVEILNASAHYPVKVLAQLERP